MSNPKVATRPPSDPTGRFHEGTHHAGAAYVVHWLPRPEDPELDWACPDCGERFVKRTVDTRRVWVPNKPAPAVSPATAKKRAKRANRAA